MSTVLLDVTDWAHPHHPRMHFWVIFGHAEKLLGQRHRFVGLHIAWQPAVHNFPKTVRFREEMGLSAGRTGLHVRGEGVSDRTTPFQPCGAAIMVRPICADVYAARARE